MYFKSEPCRDELTRFLEHEKQLGRDDLILPIYFVEAPVFERNDLLAKDPLASAIAKRPRYDFRVQADLALDDPERSVSCGISRSRWPRRSRAPRVSKLRPIPLISTRRQGPLLRPP